MDRPRLGTVCSGTMFPIKDFIETTGVVPNQNEKDTEQSDEQEISCVISEFPKTPGECKKVALKKVDSFLREYALYNSKTISYHRNNKRPKQLLGQVKIAFEDQVIHERSPHTIPYALAVDRMLFRKTESIKNNGKRRKRVKNKYSAAKKAPTTVAVRKSKVENSRSFLLELGESNHETGNVVSEKTKPRQKILKREENISEKTAQDEMQQPLTWEQHVISKLSKESADVVLKDGTSRNNADKLREFLTQRALNAQKVRGENETVENQIADKTNIRDDSKDVILNVQDKKSDEEYFEGVECHMEETRNMQEIFPSKASNWYTRDRGCTSKVGRWSRGMKKWAGPPTKQTEEITVIQEVTDIDLYDSMRDARRSRQPPKIGANLIHAINEWRNKWMLERDWERKSIKTLLEAMESLNNHIRLSAVSAIPVAFIAHHEERPKSDDEEIMKDRTEKEMISSISGLLVDSSPYVALAAAATLYSINCVSHEATSILKSSVENGLPDEQWLALQCLCEYSHHEDCIVRALVHCLTINDLKRQKMAEVMLQKLSLLTISVLYMIAEKLNSACWKDRVIAAKVIPTLGCDITTDIANKLCHLSWNDCNEEVREMTGLALGKSGNGKLMHASLRRLLESNDTKKQLQALRKLTSLGLMSVHFMAPLLNCLSSEDNVVALQAIKTCKKLKLNDLSILKTLCANINLDQPVKLKKFIIKALESIGSQEPIVRNVLLDTVHFHPEATLRKAACSAIMKLGLRDKDIIKVLQDLAYIDESVTVRNTCRMALGALGLKVVGDVNLTEAIEARVKELGRRENIIEHIISTEKAAKEKIEKLPSIANSMSYTDNVVETAEVIETAEVVEIPEVVVTPPFTLEEDDIGMYEIIS